MGKREQYCAKCGETKRSCTCKRVLFFFKVRVSDHDKSDTIRRKMFRRYDNPSN